MTLSSSFLPLLIIKFIHLFYAKFFPFKLKFRWTKSKIFKVILCYKYRLPCTHFLHRHYKNRFLVLQNKTHYLIRYRFFMWRIVSWHRLSPYLFLSFRHWKKHFGLLTQWYYIMHYSSHHCKKIDAWVKISFLYHK